MLSTPLSVAFPIGLRFPKEPYLAHDSPIISRHRLQLRLNKSPIGSHLAKHWNAPGHCEHCLASTGLSILETRQHLLMQCPQYAAARVICSTAIDKAFTGNDSNSSNNNRSSSSSLSAQPQQQRHQLQQSDRLTLPLILGHVHGLPPQTQQLILQATSDFLQSVIALRPLSLINYSAASLAEQRKQQQLQPAQDIQILPSQPQPDSESNEQQLQ